MDNYFNKEWPLKVHLCCGRHISKGWTNVDAVDYGQEIVADLTKRWDCFEDNSVDYIFCKDGYEHQPSVEHFLSECSRVLKPGGILEIWVPHFKNPAAYRITHLHFISWSYFEVFPEPHDKVQNLKILSNRIILGKEDNFPWSFIHNVMNISPKWWERLFYVSNIHVKLQKI